MAKTASSTGDAAKTNGFDASKVPAYIERVENVQAEIDKIMADAKEECAPHYEDIAAIKKEAHETHSIPRRELNSAITERKLTAKAKAVRGKLSSEQQDNFDRIKQALGDLDGTPLGAAAEKHGLADVLHH